MGWIIKLKSYGRFEHIEEWSHKENSEKLFLTEVSHFYEFYISELADGEIIPTENPTILNNEKAFDPFNYENGSEVSYDVSPKQYLKITNAKGNSCTGGDENININLGQIAPLILNICLIAASQFNYGYSEIYLAVIVTFCVLLAGIMQMILLKFQFARLRRRYEEVCKGFFEGIIGKQKMYALNGSEKEEETNISAFNYLSHIGFIFNESENKMYGDLEVIEKKD